MNLTKLAEIAQIASFVLTVALLVWPMLKRKMPQPMLSWPVLLVLAVWGLATIYLYFNPVRGEKDLAVMYEHWDKMSLQLVSNQSFRNEIIPLDGYHYDHCKFSNVTFFYRGEKPFKFTNNELFGGILEFQRPDLELVARLVKTWPSEAKVWEGTPSDLRLRQKLRNFP
jgi:hypothetical protein